MCLLIVQKPLVVGIVHAQASVDIAEIISIVDEQVHVTVICVVVVINSFTSILCSNHIKIFVLKQFVLSRLAQWLHTKFLLGIRNCLHQAQEEENHNCQAGSLPVCCLETHLFVYVKCEILQTSILKKVVSSGNIVGTSSFVNVAAAVRNFLLHKIKPVRVVMNATALIP